MLLQSDGKGPLVPSNGRGMEANWLGGVTAGRTRRPTVSVFCALHGPKHKAT